MPIRVWVGLGWVVGYDLLRIFPQRTVAGKSSVQAHAQEAICTATCSTPRPGRLGPRQDPPTPAEHSATQTSDPRQGHFSPGWDHAQTRRSGRSLTVAVTPDKGTTRNSKVPTSRLVPDMVPPEWVLRQSPTLGCQVTKDTGLARSPVTSSPPAGREPQRPSPPT